MYRVIEGTMFPIHFARNVSWPDARWTRSMVEQCALSCQRRNHGEYVMRWLMAVDAVEGITLAFC